MPSITFSSALAHAIASSLDESLAIVIVERSLPLTWTAISIELSTVFASSYSGHFSSDKNDVLTDMVLYLLPGEEEMLENESDWFEIYYETTNEYHYPDSWDGEVYYIKCTNPPHCNRKLRPIQCRSFPLSPHLDKDNNLHLMIWHTNVL